MIFPRVCNDSFLEQLIQKLGDVPNSWASAVWTDLQWLTFFLHFSTALDGLLPSGALLFAATDNHTIKW